VTIAAAVAAVVGDGAVITDPDVADAYRHDQTPMLDAGRPAVVCFASSTHEVAAVMRIASETRTPVVTRGAGSGLAGGANAVDGCIVLVTTRMDRVLEVDPLNQLARVQPGVLNADVKAAAAQHGLSYPPDPASYAFSTIGGNIATNAGGLCCVKYGVTGDYVLGLKAVLADGRVLRTGRSTVKGVAGYDLTSLLVGSEGTLAVITEATLRLRPAPGRTSTMVAVFPTLVAAGRAVVEISRAGVVPSLLELMDHTTIVAVDDWQHMDLDRDAAALLLAQSDSADGGGTAAIAAACSQAGADFAVETDDPDEGEMLLAARRFAYPALERLGATLLDDVCVPRSRIPELVEGVEDIARSHAVTVGTFGHAGDGNLHPTFVYERGSEAAEQAVLRAFDDVVRLAVSLGGTVSGEHGIGLLKRGHLADELGPVSVDVHRAVKAAFDPLGILNPGKSIP
jgi:glycolate oxidase